MEIKYFTFEKKNLVVYFILSVLVVFIIFKSFYNAPRNIEINGDRVTIDFGKHHIIANIGPETTESYVINNGFSSNSSHGLFIAWPMSKANELKSRYGDFTHCGSAGSTEGMSSLSQVVLFARNPNVENKIKTVIKKSLNEPVIELTASRLNIEEHTYNKAKYAWIDPSTQEIYYLVNDIKIIKGNYNK
jgi:hypothetical protein